MRRSLPLAALLLLLAAPGAGAISGGTTLPIGQAPYVAWVFGECTGALISPTRILTAGHCLDGRSAGGAQVIVGADPTSFGSRQRAAAALPIRGFSVDPRYRLAFPFSHRSHQSATAVNDIGLILLKRPVTGVTPVRVAGPGDAALEAPGTQATVMGYGETAPPSVRGPAPRVPLQAAVLPVIAQAACAQAYPGAVTASMICTQDPAQHTPLVQPCAGDSGGPLVVASPAGPVEIGVTSWGSEVMNGLCGEKPLPDVLMRTSSFGSFIGERKPVIEPFVPGAPGRHVTRILGTARVGNTITCRPPRLGGAPAKLSYRWWIEAAPLTAIRGAHGPRLRITRALYRRAGAAKMVGCEATARNAGGSLRLDLSGVRLRP